MLIKQIPIRNPLRNYMYLLACEKTASAIAIDPLDHARCLSEANNMGWEIKVVANTHHHPDHIDGNGPVIAATGAELVSHIDAMNAIPNVDRGLRAGDVLRCGDMALRIMDTPGHTMSHICLLFEGSATQAAGLFCGDTLFNAGVGRCDLGGDPETMYRTFATQIFKLDDAVEVYPGHDYISNNLAFALDREPDNQAAQALQDQFAAGLDAESYISTIGMERQINVFFRLDSTQVRAGIAKSLCVDVNSLDDQATFVGLRRLRDNW